MFPFGQGLGTSGLWANTGLPRVLFDTWGCFCELSLSAHRLMLLIMSADWEHGGQGLILHWICSCSQQGTRMCSQGSNLFCPHSSANEQVLKPFAKVLSEIALCFSFKEAGGRGEEKTACANRPFPPLPDTHLKEKCRAASESTLG